MLNVRDENQFAVRVPACQTGMSPHLIEAHWSLKLVLKVDCAFAAGNFQIGSRGNVSRFFLLAHVKHWGGSEFRSLGLGALDTGLAPFADQLALLTVERGPLQQ